MDERFKKILLAQERLRGHAHVTPIMTSETLNRLVGAKIYLKCENFQRIGAFKFRGAFNAISQLSDLQKRQGVICYSSGNHAQAVALVGQILGIQIAAVMPDTAPLIKKAATAAYGAQIITYDPKIASREALAAELQAKHGYTLIPPFDHEEVIAGQGTAALELLQELKTLDLLLVPCGGGGLLSGSAIAAKGNFPPCKVIGIEPELANDATLSFQTKQLHTIHNPPTIADGTRTPCLGKITYPLVLKYVDDMRTVSEEAIMEAVRFLFYRMKLVVEPSGALGLAALLSGVVRAQGAIGVILSGGNIDAPTMSLILKT
ncbi:MAG: pyridoxal-phosphate dependent enzyme [Desulfobacteraceae bacterium]|nr:MAG: pyridoxal-phosphate dependent enzyme [Desulfobacteraceae bacterium]